MDLREHKNAIKRFLAILLGSCSSLTLLNIFEVDKQFSHSRINNATAIHSGLSKCVLNFGERIQRDVTYK